MPLSTRTGGVYAQAAGRRCQVEFIAFLEYLDREIPRAVRRIHPVLDNYPTHTGKLVEEWLEERPRFRVFHPPVDRSWMNQVGRWFGIRKRKRLRIVDFAREDHLAERLMEFVREWDEPAHRFRWTKESFDRILERGESVRGAAVA